MIYKLFGIEFDLEQFWSPEHPNYDEKKWPVAFSFCPDASDANINEEEFLEREGTFLDQHTTSGKVIKVRRIDEEGDEHIAYTMKDEEGNYGVLEDGKWIGKAVLNNKLTYIIFEDACFKQILIDSKKEKLKDMPWEEYCEMRFPEESDEKEEWDD